MNEQLFFSLISAIFIGGTAGYLGSLMITKRMALVGDALGHVALPGMGLALIFGLNPSLGAFLFLFLGILLIWILGIKTSIPEEALVGVVFVTSLAAGFLIVPEPELFHALTGDISHVSFGAAVLAAIFSCLVFLLLKKIYPGMVLTGISEDLARTEGVNLKKQNFIYFLSIAAIVALGIKITGSLFVGALVIVPAASARNLSRNSKEYTFFSFVFGVVSSVAGIAIYAVYGLPAGPMIILSSIAIFILSILPQFFLRISRRRRF